MRTTAMTFDGDATPDAVIADEPCEVLTWRENGAGTTAVDVYQPGITDVPFRLYKGEAYSFATGNGNLFQRGQVVGYVKAVTVGTYTAAKKHSP